MPYTIRKTDGSIIATIPDGTVDNSSTSLFLLGKNYSGFGTDLNTDLIYLLENFAYTSPPSNMLTGQLWYNTGSGRINVFDGSIWRPVGAPFVSSNRPASLVQGDLWIDTANQQLSFYDGINLITAGPSYSQSQGRTGFIPTTIVDTVGNGHTIAELYVGNTLMAILSQTSFTPQISINGFPQIYAGLQFSSAVTNNTITAAVASANNLIEYGTSNYLDSRNFYRIDQVNNALAQLNIVTNSGISVGAKGNLVITVDSSDNVLITHTEIEKRIDIVTKNSLGSVVTMRALPETTYFYPNASPATYSTVDMNNSLIVRGNLTVLGTNVTVNTTTLQVVHQVIELATVDSPSNTTASGAGILIHGGVANDKSFKWYQSQTVSGITIPSGFYSSENINLQTGSSYYIANQSVLSQTTLGSTVLTSSLTSVGNLTSLTAAQFSFANSTMTVANNNDLTISLGANNKVTFALPARIANVTDPVYAQDAATKNYVDTSISKNTLYLTLDITGLSNPNTDMVAALNALAPATSFQINTQARVMSITHVFSTQTLSGSVSYPTQPVLVQASPSGTATVLTSVAVSTTIPTTNITTTRIVKIFKVTNPGSGNVWTWQSDVTF
jgi:hypothetical protein